MTLAALTPEVTYNGNGASIEFVAPFRFLAGTLVVERIAEDGETETLTADVDYTVTGGETDDGGTVTLTEVPATGELVRITRSTELAQQTDYETNDTFPAETHEQRLDQQMMVAQEIKVDVDDTRARAVMFRPGSAAPSFLPQLEDLKSHVLGMDADGGWIPVNPATATPSDTLGIEHEGEVLAEVINRDISTDPAEIVTVIANATLEPTAMNRIVEITGAAPTIALSMPPAGADNVGDCVYILVRNTYVGLVTCTAYPASGHLFGEQANRVMHAGEAALMMFTGSGWTKIAGVTKPFAGSIGQGSAAHDVTNTAATGPLAFTYLPLPSVEADREASQPWFSIDHLVIPRHGTYRMTLEMWFAGITMTAPNYGAPVGTEQGVVVHFGITKNYGTSVSPERQGDGLLHYPHANRSATFTTSLYLGAGVAVGAVFRCGQLALTAVTAKYTNAQLRCRLSFQETPEW
jgi:hypothetical protein